MAGMKAYFGGDPDSQCKCKLCPVGDILFLYFYLFRFLFLSAVEEEEAAAMMG